MHRLLGTPRISGEVFTLHIGYGAFLTGVVTLTIRYLPLLSQGENAELYLFGAIFAVAGGGAVVVSIFSDYIGRLAMLLVPKAMRKARMDALRQYRLALDAWERRKAAAEAKGEQFDEPQPGIEQFA